MVKKKVQESCKKTFGSAIAEERGCLHALGGHAKVDLPPKSHSGTDNHMIGQFSLFLHNPFTTEADGIKVSLWRSSITAIGLRKNQPDRAFSRFSTSG
jgi:hypothetical protein